VIFVLGIGLGVFLIYRDSRPPAESKPLTSSAAPPIDVAKMPEAAPKTVPLANPGLPPAPAVVSPRPAGDAGYSSAVPGPVSQQLISLGGDDALLRPYTVPYTGSGAMDPRLRRQAMQSKSDPRMRRMYQESPQGNGR
jgi:hypothetical protein